jgi:hypothetical protein
VFRERHTLWKILTMLKIIIRDNGLFDAINPAIIREDPLLEAALGKREIHVGDIIF